MVAQMTEHMDGISWKLGETIKYRTPFKLVCYLEWDA